MDDGLQLFECSALIAKGFLKLKQVYSKGLNHFHSYKVIKRLSAICAKVIQIQKKQ